MLSNLVHFQPTSGRPRALELGTLPADLRQKRSPRTYHHLRRPRGPFFASGGFISTASGRPPAANLYRWRALLQSNSQRLWQTSSRPPADTLTSNVPPPPADLRQTRSPRTYHHLRRPRGALLRLLGYVSVFSTSNGPTTSSLDMLYGSSNSLSELINFARSIDNRLSYRSLDSILGPSTLQWPPV